MEWDCLERSREFRLFSKSMDGFVRCLFVYGKRGCSYLIFYCSPDLLD